MPFYHVSLYAVICIGSIKSRPFLTERRHRKPAMFDTLQATSMLRPTWSNFEMVFLGATANAKKSSLLLYAYKNITSDIIHCLSCAALKPNITRSQRINTKPVPLLPPKHASMHTRSNGPITVGFTNFSITHASTWWWKHDKLMKCHAYWVYQATNGAYWCTSWSFAGNRIQWNFLGQWCSVCWWFGATKLRAHPEDGDGVSSRNAEKTSHPDAAVCPRFHWLRIEFTSDKENAYWI